MSRYACIKLWCKMLTLPTKSIILVDSFNLKTHFQIVFLLVCRQPKVISPKTLATERPIIRPMYARHRKRSLRNKVSSTMANMRDTAALWTIWLLVHYCVLTFHASRNHLAYLGKMESAQIASLWSPGEQERALFGTWLLETPWHYHTLDCLHRGLVA